MISTKATGNHLYGDGSGTLYALSDQNGNQNSDILIPVMYLKRSDQGSYTRVSEYHKIVLRVLPEITDRKGANYSEEKIIGRSYPLKTFTSGESRSIGMKVHLLSLSKKEVRENLKHLRALQSAVYPEDFDESAPFLPPPVCKIRVGKLLTSRQDGYLCALLKSYSISYPVDVAWDEEVMLPYKFEVDCEWDVVYSNRDLPGQSRIYTDLL